MKTRSIIFMIVSIFAVFFTMSAIHASETGRLALDFSPEPAEVYIDGKKYATQSGVFKLGTGDHTVEIKKKGYVTEHFNVFIGPDAVITKTVSLNPVRKKETVQKKKLRKYKADGSFSKTPMVKVPEGWFIMGSDNGSNDEKYRHEVYLDDFYIEKYEVSAAQYAAFLNNVADSEKAKKYADVSCDRCTVMYGDASEPYFKTVRGKRVEVRRTVKKYFPRKGYENRPANYISWHGANAYCRWIGRRLPTEAEWEKAARGTDGRKYPWGNNDSSKNHNLAVYDYNGHDDKWTDMKDVDSLSAGRSPYGAHHMAGNVWEWVADWYDETYYQKGVIENPRGPSSGSSRVLRGGSWDYGMRSVRLAFRNNYSPEDRSDSLGFRCAQ
ncbi:formylglycine-generating enzyme [Candidatus Magnetomoraceae bacterium gMMP-1]